MNRRNFLILTALALSALTGCHRTLTSTEQPELVGLSGSPGGSAPRPLLPRYEIFVDLTPSVNIAANGQLTSRIPQNTLEIVQALAAQNGDSEFTVDIRGITSNSNSENYVLTHSFNAENQGPAQEQAFLNELPGDVMDWLETYQKLDLKGTDLYGCLHKISTLSKGLLPNQKIVAIFLSDMIHEVIPDHGPAHFARPTSVYTLLCNDDGDPAVLAEARNAFDQHVTDAGGVVTPVTDTGVLIKLLQQPGGNGQ